MAVILKNKGKISRLFQLPRSMISAGMASAPGTQVRITRTAKGDVGVVRKQVSFPPVLSLRAGASSEPLPDAVLKVPEIASALSDRTSGLIVARTIPDSQPAAAEPAAPKAKTRARK